MSHNHQHQHPDSRGVVYDHEHPHGHGAGDRHTRTDGHGHSHSHGEPAGVVNRRPDLDPNGEPISLAAFIALKYPDKDADRGADSDEHGGSGPG